MAKVKTNDPNIKSTVVLTTIIEFDDNGIAEVDDEDVLKILKDVGEQTGTYEVFQDKKEEAKPKNVAKGKAKSSKNKE